MPTHTLLVQAYAACEPGEDHKAALGKMVSGLGLQNVSERAIAHPEARQALRAVLRTWLPLSGGLRLRLPLPLPLGICTVRAGRYSS